MTSPPAAPLPKPRPGGTTSPTKNDLITLARVALDVWEIPFSQNKIVRLALRFKARAPHADGPMFLQFLAGQLHVEPRAAMRKVLIDPRFRKVIRMAAKRVVNGAVAVAVTEDRLATLEAMRSRLARRSTRPAISGRWS